MSTAEVDPQGGEVPEWTLGDRLAKARQWRKISTTAMAKTMSVDRKTINNWESGRRKPPLSAVVIWGWTTKTDLGWLRDGITAPDNGPDLGDRTLCCTPPTSLAEARKARRPSPRVNPLPLVA